jgi:NAD(P)-dependent dehydrogenase (short-subunit alcohol dehydrogenase family)
MLAETFEKPDARNRVESMTLVGRSADPSEIAEAIAWLVSPASSFVHGETLTVDGGIVLD